MKSPLLIKSALFSTFFIVIIGIVLYFPTLNFGWHFDDLSYIVHNPAIKNIKNLRAIWDFNPARFLVMFSFAVNFAVHQYDLWGYHAVNITIHILTALMVGWFVLLIFNTPVILRSEQSRYKDLFSFFCALLFLCHPIQTQAVTYISQRFACMATLFYLASLCCYLKARLNKNIVYFGLFVLFGFMGMLSKQIVLTMPLIVILLELGFLKVEDENRQEKKYRKVILAVLLGMLLFIPGLYSFKVINVIMGHNTSGSHEGDYVTSGTYLLTQFRVIWMYIKLMFLPMGQNLLYDFPLSQSLFEFQTLISFAGLILLWVGALSLWRYHRLMSFGLLWFLITLLVESSVIPIRHVIFDHRLYLPSVGLLIFFCAAVFSGMTNKKKCVISLSIIVLCLMYLTSMRNKVWKDEFTLWNDVIKKNARETRAYMNLGIAYSEINDYTQAIKYFDQGLAINPHSTLTYNNRGLLYGRMKQYDLALADLNKAISLNEEHPEIYSNRGDIYRILGSFDLALKDYNQALRIYPNLDQTLVSRGVVYFNLGQYAMAMQDFAKAIFINPQLVSAYMNRGIVYGRTRDYEKALDEFNKAIILDPNGADIFNNRGNVFRRLNRPQEALADYGRAIEINPNLAEAFNNRGIILKNQQSFDLALADFNKAIQLDREYKSAYSNRGNLYAQSGKYEMALYDYNMALELDPQFVEAYLNRALLYLYRGQLPLALADVERAIAIDPKNSQAKAIREQINAAIKAMPAK